MAKNISKSSPKTPARPSTFDVLQQQIDQLFDDFSRGFPWPDFSPMGEPAMLPAMELTHSDKSVSLSVELPGVEEKDIDISVAGDTLTVSGEKKSETERKNGDRHVTERSYGSFSRSVGLPFDIDPDLVEARFDNGVLKLEIGKPAHARETTRKIAIKH